MIRSVPLGDPRSNGSVFVQVSKGVRGCASVLRVCMCVYCH
uniref:Uncharacterized protein n=1 Tax=Anguilla anguilla TaxID=7936 RepID=A0A0E9Q953_ANGAN